MQRDGAEITLSAVARRAKVHRSFLHRHTDLRAEILAAAEQPATMSANGGVTRRTLDADNLNLRETVRRQAQHIAGPRDSAVRTPRRPGLRPVGAGCAA